MKTLLLSLSLLTALSSFAQNPHNILRQYKNNDGVMSIKFDGDVMDIITAEEGQDVKSELEFMDIIVFKEGTDITETDQVKLKSALQAQNFELLINAKEGKNRVKVMGLDEGETISQVYINANTEKFNVYVVAKGKLYFDELKNLNLEQIDNIF